MMRSPFFSSTLRAAGSVSAAPRDAARTRLSGMARQRDANMMRFSRIGHPKYKAKSTRWRGGMQRPNRTGAREVATFALEGQRTVGDDSPLPVRRYDGQWTTDKEPGIVNDVLTLILA